MKGFMFLFLVIIGHNQRITVVVMTGNHDTCCN